MSLMEISCSANSIPRGWLRFKVHPSLPLFMLLKPPLRFTPGTASAKGGQTLVVNRCCVSTKITSAPSQPKIWAVKGMATIWPKSAIRMPVNGFSIIVFWNF